MLRVPQTLDGQDEPFWKAVIVPAASIVSAIYLLISTSGAIGPTMLSLYLGMTVQTLSSSREDSGPSFKGPGCWISRPEKQQTRNAASEWRCLLRKPTAHAAMVSRVMRDGACC